MKTRTIGMLGGIVWLASSLAWAQETRSSVTVIQPGAGGETRIITVDKTTQDAIDQQEAQAPRQRPAVQADDAPRKARIIVLPAIFAQERQRRLDRVLQQLFGFNDPGVWESPGFTSYVVDALVNTRKFDMLERGTLDALIKEMQFGETEFADAGKVAQIGQMAGADYAVIPEIRYLEIDRQVVQVPYVGGQQTTLQAKLATALRTVDVATGRIIASSIDETEKKVRPRQNMTERIAVQDLFAEAFKEIAIREASNIADVAYPIRIMSVTGNTVMLNRGRGALLDGEELRVFATGEMLIDPDTKENLGYHEAYVATVKVTEIDQRTSKATVIEQEAAIKNLYVCRRVKPPTRDKTPVTQAPPKID